MNELTAEVVRDLLDYNPETGIFRWKVRDRKYCKSDKGWKIINGRDAGATAGYDSPDGYRYIGIFDNHHLSHRLAWLHYYGEWPNDQIDHINQIKDDNRIENLREATRSQNGMNRSSYNGTASQYKGVGWHKHANKWNAYIQINGKKIHLGYFTIEIEAARAYDRAAIEHFGIYANLNFPIEDYLDYLEELNIAA